MSTRLFLETLEDEFQKTKSLADRAIAQLSDDDLHFQINPLQNSIATIMQHLAGTMVSRFTDFLTSDGEKPNHDREADLSDRHLSREQLLEIWTHGWQTLFAALAPLTDADLTRTVTIRDEPHTVLKAINRQTAHLSWHASQIALVGKHLRMKEWHYLTIPPGGSKTFNKKWDPARKSS